MRYYVESDGRVFLVDRDGILDLPRAGEIPFDLEEIAPLATSVSVTFCVPDLARHPVEWPMKDDLAREPRAGSLVREAVLATMPRVVVEGVWLRGRDVLLVKGSRGLNEGRWSLPGGFLRFGETPAQGVLREVEEEVGVPARLEGLLAVKGKQGQKSLLQWVMIFFRVCAEGEPSPDPDEISEARFVPLGEAASLVSDELIREMLSSLSESRPL